MSLPYTKQMLRSILSFLDFAFFPGSSQAEKDKQKNQLISNLLAKVLREEHESVPEELKMLCSWHKDFKPQEEANWQSDAYTGQVLDVNKSKDWQKAFKAVITTMIEDYPEKDNTDPNSGQSVSQALVVVDPQAAAAKKAKELQDAKTKAAAEAKRAAKWAQYRMQKVQEADSESEVQDALALVDDGTVDLSSPVKQDSAGAGSQPIRIILPKRKQSDDEVLAGGGASARDKAKALLAGDPANLDQEDPTDAALSGIKRVRVSRWDLVSTKPEVRTQVETDEQGRMLTKKKAKLTEEEWRQVALRVADTHFVGAEGGVNNKERQFYISHYHNMSRMIPKYNFAQVLEFDTQIRAEMADGLRTSWDPVPIMQEWYNRNGMWSEASASTNDVTKKKQEKAKKERTCNDYNSARGCSRPTTGAGKCRYAHKCSKCGGSHSRTSCTAK